ncbi:MAG: hypothetical protein KKH91_03555 [Elusimicrobia bacterium]|nr:hypothetical protein [Elusimicrobiota bacterium]
MRKEKQKEQKLEKRLLIKVNRRFKLRFFSSAIFCIQCCAIALNASSLNLDTDYKLTGVSYPNLDFDTSTSTDSRAYYTQRLRITLSGKFSPDIEIVARLQAIGVVGSTIPYQQNASTTNTTVYFQQFDWQKKYPYPNINFNPFIENAYIKAANFSGLPLELTIGRQPIEYGNGLIISDNNAGMNALRFAFDYPAKLHSEFFTAKIAENFTQAKDFDLQGLIFKYPLKNSDLELGYFEEKDMSGTPYVQGRKSEATSNISKTFYDFIVSKKGNWGFYSFEYAMQKGNIMLLNNQSDSNGNLVELDGKAFVAQGRLINDKTRLGKVQAYALLSGSTGDSDSSSTGSGNKTNTALESFDKDESFTPDFSRKYNGLRKSGWGEYFAGSLNDSLWDVPRSLVNDSSYGAPYYSGLGAFCIGLDFSPMYGWTFGVAQYAYSASEIYNPSGVSSMGQGGGTGGAGLEYLSGVFLTGDINSRKYSLGGELDLSATYVYSKYLEFKFGFSRFTPPNNVFVWPKTLTTEMFIFETTCRF